MQDTQARRVAERSIALPEGSVPDGTRGRILEASLGLFAESGFSGTSIRSVAWATGITSASLYSHYASKEEILRDLVMIGITELRDRIMIALVPLTTPAERLTALVATHVEAHASFPLLALVTNTELHALSTEFAAPAIAIRTELFGLLKSVLDDGVANGSFTVSDVTAAGHAISGMGLHVATWFQSEDPAEPARLGAQFAEFGLRMVGGA